MLFRVIDNLFSNIRKYADPEQPVALSADLQGDRLHIRVANGTFAVAPHNVESNRIGLQTCHKLVAAMGGEFNQNRTRDTFSVEVLLPLHESTT
jgi:glucose-6-phosphate-specific signal transduction histidine kinase